MPLIISQTAGTGHSTVQVRVDDLSWRPMPLVSSSTKAWFFWEAFLPMKTIHSAEPFIRLNLETIELIITRKWF